MEFDVLVAERKFAEQEKGKYSFEEKEESPKAEIGLEFDNVPAQLAKSASVSQGAYITNVKPGSLADEAGLVGSEQKQGVVDIIVSANGKPVNNRDDLLNAVKALKSGDPVILKFLRVGRLDNRVQTNTFYTSVVKP